MRCDFSLRSVKRAACNWSGSVCKYTSILLDFHDPQRRSVDDSTFRRGAQLGNELDFAGVFENLERMRELLPLARASQPVFPHAAAQAQSKSLPPRIGQGHNIFRFRNRLQPVTPFRQEYLSPP